jgi:type II secretory pathway component PulC
MGRLGIRIANALLVSLCCFQVAGVVNKISADALVPDLQSASAAPPPVATPQRSWEDRAPILARNLFGAQIVGTAPEPEPEVDQDLEETALPVELVGTLLSDVPERSKAAIAERGSSEPEWLHEGEKLTQHQRVKVAKIERGRVILQNGGKREELLLSEESLASTGVGRTAERAPTRRRPQARPTQRALPVRRSADSDCRRSNWERVR